jgi:subtilisin family serine protease
MKVTLTEYLNVRVGQPSINAPCYQYLAPGSEIEVDDTLHKGDPFEGKDTWVKDAGGNYYWSGGFEKNGLKNNLLKNITEKWWLKDFNIPELWIRGFTGKGIKIAVLDTGISYPHEDLKLDNELFHDATASPTGPNDRLGHGTHCAGIIKSSTGQSGTVGIAYNSILYVCKVTSDNSGDKARYLTDGINWALSQEVDIISISKGNPFYDKNLEAVIAKANTQGVLVICAAGNKIDGYADDHIYYPARYAHTLSVGGLQKERTPLTDSILTNETSLFAPGKELLSTYKNNDYVSLSGSSQAAPFVAGVAALALEHKRKSDPAFKASGLKKLLLDTADVSHFGKIINPLKLFI